MKKVNLFIIGAAKSGTTALYHYLSKHPDIYMSPVKEPHFFTEAIHFEDKKLPAIELSKEYHSKVIKDFKDYHYLFKRGENHAFRGEASPSYLWDKEAAQRLYQYNPDAKIIAILRDPIERAYSHYQMAYQLGQVNQNSFISALKKDEQKKDKIWGRDPLYIELGNYCSQLDRYSALFSKDQIKIIKSVELKTDRIKCLNDVFNFLNIPELDSEIIIDHKSKNVAVTAKYNWVRKIRNTQIHKVLKNVIGESGSKKLKNILYKKGYDHQKSIDSKSVLFLQKKYEGELKNLKSKYNIEF